MLVGIAHGTQRLTLVLFLAQRLTLVEFLLASSQRNFCLDTAILEIQAQRNDGETFGLALTCQLVDLRRMKQQLTLALRGMIVPRTIEIFRNVGSLLTAATGL